jgi:hypothetical protein
MVLVELKLWASPQFIYYDSITSLKFNFLNSLHDVFALEITFLLCCKPEFTSCLNRERSKLIDISNVQINFC